RLRAARASSMGRALALAYSSAAPSLRRSSTPTLITIPRRLTIRPPTIRNRITRRRPGTWSRNRRRPPPPGITVPALAPTTLTFANARRAGSAYRRSRRRKTLSPAGPLPGIAEKPLPRVDVARARHLRNGFARIFARSRLVIYSGGNMTYVLRAGLVVAMSLGLVHYAPNVRGDDSNARPSGATFKLFGNAALTKDPENPTNVVLRIVNDGGTPAGAFRD